MGKLKLQKGISAFFTMLMVLLLLTLAVPLAVPVLASSPATLQVVGPTGAIGPGNDCPGH